MRTLVAVVLLYGSLGSLYAQTYAIPPGVRSGAIADIPATCAIGNQYWATDAIAGQNHYDCTSANVWTLSSSAVPTSGGGGTPSNGILGDFWVVRTSATILTIGPNCTSTLPCKVAFGTALYTLSAPATATISAGTDTAYIYVSAAQVLTVGVNSASLTCSGCTRVAGITSFPASSFPLWNWTSTSGAWDVLGSTDKRNVIQKGADPLAAYVLTSADTQLPNAVTSLPTANMAAAALVRTCEIVVGDPGAASSVLADDNDTPDVCANKAGATLTITGVNCYAPTGSPTVTPIISGGSATSILSSALTCSSTQGGASGTLNGTPTQTNGQTIDGNITTAGGTAKYLVIIVTRTL